MKAIIKNIFKHGFEIYDLSKIQCFIHQREKYELFHFCSKTVIVENRVKTFNIYICIYSLFKRNEAQKII